MSEALTPQEELACIVALAELLAGPATLDDYDERLRLGEPEVGRAMLSAFTKLNRNREAREARARRQEPGVVW